MENFQADERVHGGRERLEGNGESEHRGGGRFGMGRAVRVIWGG